MKFVVGCLVAAGLAGAVVAEGLPRQTTLRHACDGSAAVLLPDGLLTANDESNTLLLYGSNAELLGRGDLTAPIESALGRKLVSKKGVTREIDVEAAAVVDDRIYWIGSHGLNKSGKSRPNRRLFFATGVPDPADRFDLSIVGTPISLYDALAGLPKWGSEIDRVSTDPKPDATRPRPPKEGSLNIEGLGANGKGELLIGLRAPLFGQFDANLGHDPMRGRALVVLLRNPAEVLESGAAPELDGFELDLDDRGVRSLHWSTDRDAWIVLAGPVDSTGDFALFEWKGPDDDPRRIGVSLDGNPEAMVSHPGGVFILTDDGTRSIDGLECKQRLAAFLEQHRKKPFDKTPLPPRELSFEGYAVNLADNPD